MKPHIDATEFGSITIGGKTYEHDVLIRPDGAVEKRKKKLSKAVFGTSHVISLAEAEHVYRKGVERILVGTGQSGMVTLSDEAADLFRRKGCRVELMPTPKVVEAWNTAQGAVTALIHITC